MRKYKRRYKDTAFQIYIIQVHIKMQHAIYRYSIHQYIIYIYNNLLKCVTRPQENFQFLSEIFD